MNEKKKKTSLIFNLIILIGVNILALTLVQVTVLSKAAKDSSRQDHVESYVLLTKTIQMNMENILEGYFKELDAYANADIMREGNFDKAGRWLQNHPEIRGKDFDYIMLIGKDGISYNDNGTRTDVSTRDYVKAIMQNGQKRFVDNPVVSKTTGKRVIHITRSVYDENGNLFAALAGVMNVDILVQPIKNLKVPDGIWVFLIDHNGTVIYHPFATEEGNFISNPGEGHEDLSEVSKRMVDGEEGHSWIVSYTGSKQDLIVYSGIAGTPWGLGFLVPGKLVDALGSKISKTALAFGLGMVVITILLGGFILSKSLKPLNIVKNAITGIAHGNADLTQRININSHNEIGQVVQGFNQFAEKMQEIIRDVKYSKSELAEAGEDMTASTQDTSSAITQILTNIDQVGDQINSQAAGVEETAGAVNEIASNIESLERMIENQSSGVAQASAAVEQMIGNIQSVNGSVDKMADSFQDLKANAQHGFSKQQDVNERIQQIEQQSSMLQEANAAISAIAEQTNLLAMNAAIEAAHAGDAGKGFAVVADEIRKLSETSTVQSKTIGDQLSNIQESIMGVVTASSESSKAFEAVSGQLTATDELVIMIKSAMEEQKEGSKQISEALKSMNNSTVEVRNASQEMAEGNKAILVEMKNLQDSSLVMKDSMSQMSAGARKINDTGLALTGVAEKIKTSIEKIGYQIDQFKV